MLTASSTQIQLLMHLSHVLTGTWAFGCYHHRRCASDVRPQLDTVLAASLKYLKHDPNYEYDESEGGDEEMADEGEEDEG